MRDKSFPGKLLLFGEYTTLLGSAALAMPLPAFSGHWTLSAPDPGSPLHPWAEYLEGLHPPLPLHTALFRKDLAKGLRFASDIPAGYGLGSSGALCAALLDRYGYDIPDDLFALRQLLARMESFFHGSSSGSDPLVSYLQQPILFRDKRDIEPVSFSVATRALLARIHLLDTGHPRQTAPLVDQFMQKLASYRTPLEAGLLPPTEQAIRAFLNGDASELEQAVQLLSQAQLLYLSDMIPDDLLSIWKKGVASGHYALKLCGAGGGGFMLLYTPETTSRWREDLEGYHIHPIQWDPRRGLKG